MNASRYFGLSLAVLAAMLLVTAVGCKSGPATGQVQGKVTFKGKPVAAGDIMFYNTKTGAAGAARIQAGGTYAVSQALPVGDYIVYITPLTHIVDTDPGKTPPSDVEKPAPDIPMKYRSQASTPLKTTIKEGRNEADFDMVP